MKRVAVVLFLIGVFLFVTATASAAPPPDPAQQRPDIFPCEGCTIQDKDGDGLRNMQDLNPVTVKAKVQRSVNYRLLTMPGCTTGTVPQDLQRVSQEARDNVGFNLVRNDGAPDFTIRINCGSEQIRYCGSVTVFCLGRGFPYIPDVEISDIISTYFPDSRLGILLHEVMGHAVGTWNEQYATCGASCGFASTPHLYDFMNTGPNSRHGYSASELGRTERTMWGLAAPCPLGPIADWGGVWDACAGLWRGPDGWDFNPMTNGWQDRVGASEWCCNTTYRPGFVGVYNRRTDTWTSWLQSVWTWRQSEPTWRCQEGCP